MRIDSFYSSISSSFLVTANDNGNAISIEVLHGREYSDNINPRRVSHNFNPHEEMLEIMRKKDLRRPERRK